MLRFNFLHVNLDAMKTLTVILVAITVALPACSENPESSSSYFNQEPVGKWHAGDVEIVIDTLLLDDVSSSFTGFTSVQDNKIHFLDAKFGWLFIFDNKGNFLQREMGQGHGPKEVPMTGIQFFAPDDNGFTILGSSADFYEFDDEFNRINNGIVRWKNEHPIEYLNKNPIPSAQRSYNYAYDTSNMRSHDGFLYIPLFTASPGFSEFHMFTDLYASEARILGELDPETGDVKRIFGRFSPIYTENPRVRTFSIFDFEILPEGDLLVSYGADSLLHRFDLEFNHLQSFGFSGKYKNNAYSELPDVSDANALRRHMFREVSERDFYTRLSCVSKQNLCFRSYKVSSDSLRNGLQIYRDDVLLADVLVPETGDHRNTNYFKIAGYSEPWFYSNIHFDEMNEQKFIYRFQITNL